MSKKKLIALATIMELNDPNESKVTMTHSYSANNDEERKIPFDKLPIESMRSEIIKEISTAGGHTIANIFRGGEGVSYREIVLDLANENKIETKPSTSVAEVEGLIAQKILKNLIEKLSEEEKKELEKNLIKEAKKFGSDFYKEGGILAALTTAQLSGFGIYLAASTALGTVTSILGISLSFAVYTGMSKVISVVIGPIGWAALGLATVYKAGSPNIKKILPAVLFIASERNHK
ncbi:MAG: hypothetical protein KBA66_24920 [Leptospiraceae bacterium]|nr:hypothetical protein [Leptospiraceae bacterium]